MVVMLSQLTTDGSALTLECPGDHGGATATATRVDDIVHEVDQLVGEPNGDLPAHPKMAAAWDRDGRARRQGGGRARRQSAPCAAG